jgi:hypothetical protein
MAPPAPRECNQPARSALHCNQFAAHRPAQRISLRIAAHCIASRVSPAALGAHLAPAALHALRSTLRSFIWFVYLVRGTNFSKIQFKHLVILAFQLV